jgi:PAS domain S-box-containing protein
VSSQVNHRICLLSWAAAVVPALCLIFLLTSHAAAQSREPKRVLLLLEEDVHWPAFHLIDENLRAVLRGGSPAGIAIFSEHLDRVHFRDAALQAEQVAWIKKKYANSNLDLVIAVGEVPAGLFADVPLLFLSADPRRKLPEAVTTASNVTSVWVSTDAQKTLELAQSLQPEARQILVIGDGSPAEDTILTRLRNLYPTSAGNMSITYVTNPAVPEICHRVAELSNDTIVIFTALSRDDEGRPLISAEVVPRIAAVSGAQLYVLADSLAGTGAIGGYVASFADVGKTGGQLGLRMLAGEHPQDVIVPNQYLFDWRQLRRWKISEAMLPPGSVILYRQPSLWESYRYYVLIGIFLCIAQTLLILALLWQRASRKKAQQAFIDLRAFENMLSKLSAIFINLPEGTVEPTIRKSLREIAELLKVDRISLFDYFPEDTEFRVGISWNGEGVDAAPVVIGMNQLPFWRDALMRGDEVLLSDLNALPPGALVEREFLQKLGTVSVATLPLMGGGDILGGISFVSTTRRVEWTEELVEELKLLAEIFSNALLRKRARDSQFMYAAIVESSNDAIVSKNLDGIILSWNAAAERLFGYSESEVVGQSIMMLVPPELREEEHSLLRRSIAGERVEHYETVRVTKHGEKVVISLTLSPVTDSAGKIIGFSKIARDITDQKRAEQLLRESEERFRLVANTAPVLIWMSGTDKLCNFFNQCWLDFTGRSLSEEIGEGWVSGVHPEDVERCLKVYSSSFDARIDFEMEYRLRRFDGEYRWVVDYGVPRIESDGKFCGYIGSCVDITERKSSEASLQSLTGRLIHVQEAERARIARELHDDFNQRLALHCIEIEQLRKRFPEKAAEERAMLGRMLQRTKGMSADIRSLSHELHSSRLEFIGLVPALSGLCKEMAEKYKIEVQFTGCDIPSNIPNDVALCLFRVTQEALGNVVKHSQTNRASVELSLNAGGVSLRIADNGVGFEPDANNPGPGIGLVGMAERLRLVGGKFAVRSEPNRGTEIFAGVPLPSNAHGERATTVAAGGFQS